MTTDDIVIKGKRYDAEELLIALRLFRNLRLLRQGFNRDIAAKIICCRKGMFISDCELITRSELANFDMPNLMEDDSESEYISYVG